jgi:hypothetical protein
MPPFISHNIQSQTIGWLVNEKFERILPWNFLGRTEETHGNSVRTFTVGMGTLLPTFRRCISPLPLGLKWEEWHYPTHCPDWAGSDNIPTLSSVSPLDLNLYIHKNSSYSDHSIFATSATFLTSTRSKGEALWEECQIVPYKPKSYKLLAVHALVYGSNS